MKGLDTNVLVRYLVRDDRAQARRAMKFILDECTANDPGFISAIVMCELVWVLERTYRLSRDVVAGIVETLLQTTQLEIEQEADVVAAAREYRRGAGFADCLITSSNRRHGGEYTVTFDRKATRLERVRLLR